MTVQHASQPSPLGMWLRQVPRLLPWPVEHEIPYTWAGHAHASKGIAALSMLRPCLNRPQRWE